MNLQYIFDSGRVQRYHSNPDMARHGQTNADHQWGCLAFLLALHPDPSPELMRAVVFHDSHELFGGDMSFHFKREHPEFTKEHERLSRFMAEDAGVPVEPDFDFEEDKLWLDFVDRLESFFYMKMHGQEWDMIHVKKLLNIADQLNIKPKVKEIIHG